MTKLTDRLVAESSLEFCRRAPRLARAHAHMQEMERVLGWMRGRWTGGVDVLVCAGNYLGHGPDSLRWAKVVRVSVGGAYPVKAEFLRDPSDIRSRQEGQWAFHEIIDLRHWDIATSGLPSPLGIGYPGSLHWDPFPEPLTDLAQLSTTLVPGVSS